MPWKVVCGHQISVHTFFFHQAYEGRLSRSCTVILSISFVLILVQRIRNKLPFARHYLAWKSRMESSYSLYW